MVALICSTRHQFPSTEVLSPIKWLLVSTKMEVLLLHPWQYLVILIIVVVLKHYSWEELLMALSVWQLP